MLIATRRSASSHSDEEYTTFVNLWQNPDGVLDAHRTAQAISETTPANLEDPGTALLTVDGQHVGELLSVPSSKIISRQWAGVQFARADLTRSILRLLDGGEVWIPGETTIANIQLCRLAEIGEIGPDVRDLWDGFDRTDSITAYPMIENHDTDQRRSVATEPDKYLVPLVEPRPGRNLKSVESLWPKAGRLLLGARFWLNTVRVVAMRSDRNVLASMWWPIRVDDEATEKALALWLNSSIGLLTLLATRNTTRGAWVQMKKADLVGMPVLDLRAITPEQLQALSQLFDDVAEEEFERLPAMAECAARHRLDDGLSEILGLPNLDGLRRLLASEPVVSNRRL